MIRLVLAEAHRWRARRGLWVVLVVGVALSILIALPMWMAAAPPSAADVEQGRAAYAQVHGDWMQHHDEMLADCQQNPPNGDKARCDEIVQEPKDKDFIPHAATFADLGKGGVEAGAVIGALLALIAAASFIGAEFRHGTLATWLTYVPGRGRVWASKGVIVVVAGAAMTLLVEAALLAAAALAMATQQGMASVTDWTPSLQIAARGVALGAAAAVTGQALAGLFRQTVAPVLLPLGYLILQGMGGILTAIPGFRYVAVWLPEHNIRAFLEAGATVMVFEPKVTDHGLEMTPVEVLIGMPQAAGYVLGATAVLALAAWSVFSRRDVA